MKIAIAVKSDDLQVAKRMGRAPWFAVYVLEEDQYELLELVENEHAKEHHEADGQSHREEYSEAEVDHHHQQIIAMNGVHVILARAVGPNMKDAIAREGIVVYRFPLSAGKTAPELMEYLIKHRDNLERFKL